MRLLNIRPVICRRLFPKPTLDGKLYISVELELSLHNCPCGCGEEVEIPLGSWPDPWDLYLSDDYEIVSLAPSIYRRHSMCQSHYVIRDNRIIWL